MKEPDLEGSRRENRRRNVALGVALVLLGAGGIAALFARRTPYDLVRGVAAVVFSYLIVWFGLFQIRGGSKDGRDDAPLLWGGIRGIGVGGLLIIGLAIVLFLYVQDSLPFP